jgi:fucose permease
MKAEETEAHDGVLQNRLFCNTSISKWGMIVLFLYVGAEVSTALYLLTWKEIRILDKKM